MALHALKDDDAGARSLDMRVKNAELALEIVFLNLIFDETLDGLLEADLIFPDADGAKTRFHQRVIQQMIGEEI
jgi:hypothetical protein